MGFTFKIHDVVGMSADVGSDDSTLSPDEAFAALSDGTRMEILRTLADADGPLSFSAVYERVSSKDSGNFTYHLDKLVGHFVEETDEGYRLRRAGERVIEAVVSGAVTETPVIEPIQTDWPCSLCGAPIVMSYQQGMMATSCSECPGLYGGEGEEAPVHEDVLEEGYLGVAPLPPAALENRTPTEVLQAAVSWSFLERLSMSNDICPRCAARVDRHLEICDDHDSGDGMCEVCDWRDPVSFEVTCPNCPYAGEGLLPTALHGHPVALDFVTDQGFNPVRPTRNQWMAMTEAKKVEVVSVDPPVARLTYSLDGDVVSITVDEDLNAIDSSGTG